MPPYEPCVSGTLWRAAAFSAHNNIIFMFFVSRIVYSGTMSTIGMLTAGLEKRYRIFTALAPVMMVGEVVMETLIPLIMAAIIDTGIRGRDIPYVMKMGGIMAGASCISLACGMLCARFAAVASQGFSRNLRRMLFARVQDFSFANIDRFSTGSLVTRLTTDVTNVQNVYAMIIRMCIRSPLMLISGTVMSFYINRRLALLFVIAVPVLALVLARIVSAAYPRFRRMLAKYDTLNTIVQENLTAVRVVKSFVRGSYETEKFAAAADDVRRMQASAERVVILTMPMMQLVIYSCIVAVLWFGGGMIIGGTMQAGELVSFIAYVTQVLMSLMMLSMVFVNLVLTRASVQRIREVLLEPLDIKNPADDGPGNYVKEVLDGSIDFSGVFFSYRPVEAASGGTADPDACVLSDINLHIDSGQTVGIIGGTGSAKTTLVQLIPRLYDTLAGRVQVGGVDVRLYDLRSLRDAVAMVLQKNVLFSGSIRDNLRWGCADASDQELEQACRAADAWEFICTLPQGLDTELGQGGVNLSGGQKQRLCIARALLKKPRILILDDSTSAVDTATDSRIRNSLRKCLPETTKLIIAQRIASVQDADVIFVLDNGRINGSGTHRSLLASNTIYREVYDSQQKGDAE